MRSEDWTQVDESGMTSSLVVEVTPEETVRVRKDMVKELRLENAPTVGVGVNRLDQLVWEFSYERVSEALKRLGWTHASASEA